MLVQWDPHLYPTPALGIAVWRGEGNSTYSLVTTVSSPEVSYLDNCLQPNTTYCYRIQAISPTGESSHLSPEVCAKTRE